MKRYNCSKSLLLISLASLFLQSCLGTSPVKYSTRINDFQGYKTTEPRSNWSKIDVFTSGDTIENHLKIASIQVTGGRGNSLKRVVNLAKQEASKYAAKGIIITSVHKVQREGYNLGQASADIVSSFSKEDEKNCCCENKYYDYDEPIDYSFTYSATRIRAIALIYGSDTTFLNQKSSTLSSARSTGNWRTK